MENTEIGVVRFRTDTPREAQEFGALEIEVLVSAEPDIYRLSLGDLQKFKVSDEVIPLMWDEQKELELGK